MGKRMMVGSALLATVIGVTAMAPRPGRRGSGRSASWRRRTARAGSDFLSPQQARGIYALGADGAIKEVARELGRLDGIYEMDDGTFLVTD